MSKKTRKAKAKVMASQYKTAKLFDTFDGEHSLFHVLNSGDCPEPNAGEPGSINILRDTQGKALTLLGCELTSLSQQWLRRARNTGESIVALDRERHRLSPAGWRESRGSRRKCP